MPAKPVRVIRLSQYITPVQPLHSKEQARWIIESERLHEPAWIEVDFTGVREAGHEFIAELFHPDTNVRPDLWLVPKNYNRCIEQLLSGYFCKLRKLREQKMQQAFAPEWLCD
ncbi:MAG TPA: hypothetical protein VLU73_14750 [Methylococcaceae bacterium]|jgi:hypothetical protein|nr:hypothetical protein [Methylococcaceae bacterium]